MKNVISCLLMLVAGLAAVPATAQTAPNGRVATIGTSERLPAEVTQKIATVGGVRINYKTTGHGPVVVLLHGFGETSHMSLPLMPLLAASRTVIAPDLRGAGLSERTTGGCDKKTLAQERSSPAQRRYSTTMAAAFAHAHG